MPIYHFNLSNAHYEPDPEGIDLPGPDVARKEAVIFAAAHLRDHPELVWDGDQFEVQVTDDAGARLFGVRIEMYDGATS